MRKFEIGRMMKLPILIFALLFHKYAFGSVEHTQCAVLKNSQLNTVTTFCDTSGNGKQCKSTGSICENSNYDSKNYNGAPYPWYQEAIYFAKNNNIPNVFLESGVITINDDNKLSHHWPLNAGGVGIRVPQGINLSGSEDFSNQTIINVDSDISTRLDAIILVGDLGANHWGENASVSYLTIAGDNGFDYWDAGSCSDLGRTMNSILETDNIVISTPRTNPNPKALSAVRVEESRRGAAPVHAHHLKIAHAAVGIEYGWNTSVQPLDPTCENFTCLRLDIVDSVDGTCPDGMSPKAKDGSDDFWCIRNYQAENCDQQMVNYCQPYPHEFLGNPQYPSHIQNNSICDVNVGINYVGGYGDVHHNIVINEDAPVGSGRLFGISVDGHWGSPTWSERVHFYHNYVYGFEIGFLTDGSQYAYVDEETFDVVLNGYPRENILEGTNQYNQLKQFIDDDVARWYSNPDFGKDLMQGMIFGAAVRDNRFFVVAPTNSEQNVVGISFYRNNWSYAGFNIVSTINSDTKSTAGVSVDHTLNSWIYGNVISNYERGISVVGQPGVQSYWGSCWNGIDLFFDASNWDFITFNNIYENVDDAVYKQPFSCIDDL